MGFTCPTRPFGSGSPVAVSPQARRSSPPLTGGAAPLPPRHCRPLSGRTGAGPPGAPARRRCGRRGGAGAGAEGGPLGRALCALSGGIVLVLPPPPVRLRGRSLPSGERGAAEVAPHARSSAGHVQERRRGERAAWQAPAASRGRARLPVAAAAAAPAAALWPRRPPRGGELRPGRVGGAEAGPAVHPGLVEELLQGETHPRLQLGQHGLRHQVRLGGDRMLAAALPRPSAAAAPVGARLLQGSVRRLGRELQLAEGG